MQIKITLNNSKQPIEYIELITSETKKNSIIYSAQYRVAQEIISMFEVMCNNKNNNLVSEKTIKIEQISGADEILKYKNLLDQGIITKEEFEQKKKQLLDL